MHKSVTVAGLTAALLAAVAVPATAAEAAAPEGGTFSVVTVNGSGCPAGTGSFRLSPTKASFTLDSPAYLASSGGESLPTDLRRNCQVNLQLNGAEGWTYAISRIDSTGFAYLNADATGTSQVSFYFQGDTATTESTLTLTGPLAEAWSSSDSIAEEDLVWAPCDAQRNLNINTELVVPPSADPAAANVMVRDAKTTGRLVWRPCEAA
jgi:hypothetical protein